MAFFTRFTAMEMLKVVSINQERPAKMALFWTVFLAAAVLCPSNLSEGKKENFLKTSFFSFPIFEKSEENSLYLVSCHKT